MEVLCFKTKKLSVFKVLSFFGHPVHAQSRIYHYMDNLKSLAIPAKCLLNGVSIAGR